MFKSAGQGITPLICLSTDRGTVKEAMNNKDIDKGDGIQKTRAEERQRRKIRMRNPPRNYYELTEMVATFAALLFVMYSEL